MKLNEMNYYKQQLGYSYDKLAELSGIPKGTIQKIFTGVTKSPRYRTLQALEAILKPRAVDYAVDQPADSMSSSNSKVAEAPYEYHVKKQGEYTLEDYYAIPDERRVELIDGVIYDMTAPSTVHQMIGFQISYQIENFIESNHGSCMPFVAPCDVQIDCDDRTMVQPDVFVLCDRSKFRNKCIYGAPEFVVEVLSPSTSKKDRHIKYEKYFTAGVKEYWMIDPFKERIIVYLFPDEKDNEVEDACTEEVFVYTFEDKVPVGIYDGALEIDFARIKDRMQRFKA